MNPTRLVRISANWLEVSFGSTLILGLGIQDGTKDAYSALGGLCLGNYGGTIHQPQIHCLMPVRIIQVADLKQVPKQTQNSMNIKG